MINNNNNTDINKNDRFICGLDFGTSNSVISITDKYNGEEIFTFSASSILYFPINSDECFVGKDAQDRYVEDGMNGRLLKSVKTLLRQDTFLFTWIHGKRVTPDQLVTHIIKYLKEKAEEFVGFELKDVVLGRPAVFSEDEKKEKIAVTRLLTAAKNAGFENIRLQLEPIAAAFSYEKKLTKKENVLVADFGGGTSDFTIISLSPDKVGKENRENDIIAHGGVYIGGDLFDSEIMWHKVTPHLGRGALYESYDKQIEVPSTIYRELRNWERSFMLKDSKERRAMDKFYIFSGNNEKINNVRVLLDNNYVYSLFKKIEKSKMELSSNESSIIEFKEESIKIEEDFHFNEFQKIISLHTKQIEEYILNMLSSSGYEASQIDTVFMTGGSSLVIPIKDILKRIFGEDKLKGGDTFHSVAHGLSLTY